MECNLIGVVLLVADLRDPNGMLVCTFDCFDRREDDRPSHLRDIIKPAREFLGSRKPVAETAPLHEPGPARYGHPVRASRIEADGDRAEVVGIELDFDLSIALLAAPCLEFLRAVIQAQNADACPPRRSGEVDPEADPHPVAIRCRSRRHKLREPNPCVARRFAAQACMPLVVIDIDAPAHE